MALKRKERTALAAAAAGLRRRDAPRVPGGGPLEASLTRSRSFAARMANIDGIDSAELSSAASAATGGVMLSSAVPSVAALAKASSSSDRTVDAEVSSLTPCNLYPPETEGGGYRVGEGALQLLRC